MYSGPAPMFGDSIFDLRGGTSEASGGGGGGTGAAGAAFGARSALCPEQAHSAAKTTHSRLRDSNRVGLMNRFSLSLLEDDPLSDDQIGDPAEPRDRLVGGIERQTRDLTQREIDAERHRRECQRVAPNHPAAVQDPAACPDVTVRVARRE